MRLVVGVKHRGFSHRARAAFWLDNGSMSAAGTAALAATTLRRPFSGMATLPMKESQLTR